MQQKNTIVRRGTRVLRCLALTWFLAMATGASRAEGPPWWTNRNVLTVSGTVTTNDFAAVNMGQLKWIATNAYDEIAGVYGASAVTNVAVLFASWLPGVSNYTAVNVGQVKYVASLFYDSLIAVGFTNAYPWTATTADDTDFAAANIGQVKQVFNFMLPTDSDGDGLVNAKETNTGVYRGPNDTGSNPSMADTDGDGTDDGVEVGNRTDPNSNDVTKPTLVISSPANGYILRWIP